MKRYLWVLIVLLSVLGMGCGRLSPPGAQPEQAPVEQPTRTPLIVIPEDAEELVQKARQALAARLDQMDEAITLIDVESAEWPTAAMGCPESDKMYAQVITPGYIVRLKTNGEVYEAHVSRRGQVVFCDEEQESMKMEVPAEADRAVMAAKQDLASRVGVDVEDVQIAEIEAVEWPDSSLGCPEPGKMYLQVITSGYRVVLQAQGQTFEYHTDRGDRAVFCGQGVVGTPSQRQRLQDIRSVVERARDDLARREEIDPAAITVLEAAPVSQIDQLAPCPEADQLDDSGRAYQIVLQVEGARYVYRARGESVVLCSQ